MTAETNTQGKSKRRASAKSSAVSTPDPTEYVVLELRDVTDQGNAILAWIEVDRTKARGGSEDLILRKWGDAAERKGAFKLVAARAWEGGLRLVEKTNLVAEPLVEPSP